MRTRTKPSTVIESLKSAMSVIRFVQSANEPFGSAATPAGGLVYVRSSISAVLSSSCASISM